MASDFVALINGDENVRPFLIKYPFTVQDISIGIFVINKKGSGLTVPYISIARLRKGEIYYNTLSDDHIPKIVREFRETYQEACEKLSNSR